MSYFSILIVIITVSPALSYRVGPSASKQGGMMASKSCKTGTTIQGIQVGLLAMCPSWTNGKHEKIES